MKKGLSMFLVLALVFSLLVPFSVSASWTTGGDVTGDATVISYQTHGETFGGRVPTGNQLDFVIDPLGLLGIGTGGSVTSGDASADIIFGGTDGNVLEAWNTSSVPVLLTVQVQLVADDAVANNMALWVQPSADAIETVGDTEAFVGYEKVVVYGTERETASFLLDEVEYDVVRSEGNVENGVVPTKRIRVEGTPHLHGTALRFAGIIDTDADWTSGVPMSVNASFIMVVAEADAIEAAKGVVGPYGWLNDFGDYKAPTLVAIPQEVIPAQQGPTEAELAADAATDAAEKATEAAETALSNLNGAIDAFGIDSDVTALESAIGAAGIALGVAKTAHEDAGKALQEADEAGLLYSNEYVEALADAIFALDTAVKALEFRIGQATGLLPPAGFTTDTHTIAGTAAPGWVTLPFVWGSYTSVDGITNNGNAVTSAAMRVGADQQDAGTIGINITQSALPRTIIVTFPDGETSTIIIRRP